MTLLRFAPEAAPRVSRGTASVRPFAAADIPQVAWVHRAAFRIADPPALSSYREYFTSVFLENPAPHRLISSLVYEEPDGRISGFVGLVPRYLTLGGRQYLAAVSSQFIVDPASHVGLVGVRLAKASLNGPQDVSIADEANDISRQIWEGVGGTTATLLSLQWTRALRPARLALSYLRGRRGLAPLAVAGLPFASVADSLMARVPASRHFRQAKPSSTGEPLSARTVVAHTAGLSGTEGSGVKYPECALQWLLDRSGRRGGGRALNAVVKNGSQVLGWYVAHLTPDGVADVAQLMASPATIHAVLDHLFYDAWRNGGVTVTGRLDPRFMQALSDKYCLFHRRGPWVLIKAKKPELLHALDSGATCFSRFDGEWSLRFHPQRA